jgi:hypothetical protein
MIAMSVSRLGVEREPPPVTLPALVLKMPPEDKRDIKLQAQRFVEMRMVKAGADAWAAIDKAESFSGWLAIGKALQVGRDHALRATQANAPMGRLYCKEFSKWIEAHGFSRMPKSTRSVAIELAEHSDAITKWRDKLPEQQKRRLIHPLSVTRRWKASLAHDNSKSPQDLKRNAAAAWRRFVSCVEALPADQAAPLWQTVHKKSSLYVINGPTCCGTFQMRF